jgi:hypothetical protein
VVGRRMTDKRVCYIDYGGAYARRGDYVTCENNHIICTFGQTVKVGDMFGDGSALVAWRQDPPKIGQEEVPVCRFCGSPFWRRGNEFHFHDGWRTVKVIKRLRGAGWFGKLWSGLRRLAHG